jgi:hypothetical protein
MAGKKETSPSVFDTIRTDGYVAIVNTITNQVVAKIYDSGMAESVKPYEVKRLRKERT